MYHWANTEVQSQKKGVWEVSRANCSGEEQRGMVWPCGVWCGMVGKVGI